MCIGCTLLTKFLFFGFEVSVVTDYLEVCSSNITSVFIVVCNLVVVMRSAHVQWPEMLSPSQRCLICFLSSK